jgi:hypothetical protein
MAPTGMAWLLAPTNGGVEDSTTPTFRWLSVGGAVKYEVEISEAAHFHTATRIASRETAATVSPDKPLQSGGLYYWRVRGGNAGGWGPWSVTWSFKVAVASD